jgi:hypothetical protein
MGCGLHDFTIYLLLPFYKRTSIFVTGDLNICIFFLEKAHPDL